MLAAYFIGEYGYDADIKAWAKVHGSYHRIGGGGQCHHTLRDLTGAPSFDYSVNIEDCWEKIQEADAKNYILTAGISSSDEDEKRHFESIGLV